MGRVLCFGTLALALLSVELQIARLSSQAEASPINLDASPVLDLRMSEQLSDNLAFMFAALERAEFIVCLEGEPTQGGELRLRDFRMPHITYSHRTGVGVDPEGTCGQYEGVVGTLHTHPPAYPEDRGREWQNCYLSRSDIVSWLDHTDYPFTLVMCGPRTWAWWHRSQVQLDQVLAFPPEGQLHGKEAAAE